MDNEMEKKMQNDMDTVAVYVGYKNEGFPKLVVTCGVSLQ